MEAGCPPASGSFLQPLPHPCLLPSPPASPPPLSAPSRHRPFSQLLFFPFRKSTPPTSQGRLGGRRPALTVSRWLARSGHPRNKPRRKPAYCPYPHRTEREAEARIVRETSGRLLPKPAVGTQLFIAFLCHPLLTLVRKGQAAVWVGPRLTRAQIVTLPSTSCAALGNQFAS